MSAPARLWLVPGDTVGILDGTTLHVWGPELEFERREAIPVLGAREAVVIQWPSEVVVNALDPSPGRREYPLHVVDLPGAGAVLSSHGGDPEPISSSSLYTRHPRSLSAAGDGGYWSAAADSWEIVRYTRDHEVAFTLSRQPEWFPERSDLSTGTFERPPSPQCKGSSEDAAGLIWMFCLVASPEYQLAYRDSSPRVTGSDEIVEARGVDVEYHRLFHTWIEAYDPEGGEIIARSLFEDAVLSVLPGGKAAFRDASERGDPLVRIHQFAVSKPSH